MQALQLSSFLPYRLSVLSNRISNTIAKDYQQRFDLRIPEWRVLALLAEHPGSTAREIANLGEMDKVAVSRSVKSLTARRLIEQTVSEADRRARPLMLSDHGAAIVQDISPLARAYEIRLLNALTPRERDELDRILVKLADAAHDLERSGGR